MVLGNVIHKEVSLNKKFTDRLKKVMQLANQETQRDNHELIGTEAILVGLVCEGTSRAARILLTRFNLDLESIRMQVHALRDPGNTKVTVGRLSFCPNTEALLRCADEEARAFNINYIGTTHLALAFTNAKMLDCTATYALCAHNISLKELREALLEEVK